MSERWVKQRLMMVHYRFLFVDSKAAMLDVLDWEVKKLDQLVSSVIIIPVNAYRNWFLVSIMGLQKSTFHIAWRYKSLMFFTFLNSHHNLNIMSTIRKKTEGLLLSWCICFGVLLVDYSIKLM